MSAERLKFNKESGLPENVREVLNDRRLHRVMSMSKQDLLSLNYTEPPWRFWIDRVPQDDLNTISKESEGQCYILDFRPQSWTCEEFNLRCTGTVILENNPISAQLLVVGDVPYFKL